MIAAILLMAVPLVGCAEDGAAPEDGEDETVQVAALDNEFDPASVSLSLNGMVEWTNQGDAAHTVEIEHEDGEMMLHSEEIQPGDTTSFVFEEAGTYDVWCAYHGSAGQGMAMTVTVG